MMDMLIQFAKADISEVSGKDCLCESCDSLCGNITPIYIYYLLLSIPLIIFVVGFILRIKARRDKKKMLRADIIMVIGFVCLILFILFEVIGSIIHA